MSIIEFLNPVKIIVFLAFVYMIFSFDKSRKIHLILLGILSVSLLNEVISPIILVNHGSIALTTLLYIVINTGLWLILLKSVSGNKKTINMALLIFISFAIYNFLYIDGSSQFNFYTFVAGGLLYVSLFILNSFLELKKENMKYFAKNDYFLITSPLLFFIGLSMLLAFEDKSLHNTEIKGIALYKLINYSINTIYYSLVIIYIYIENTIKNVK